MLEAPVGELSLLESEGGELRSVISGEDRSRGRSEIIYLHVASHSQSPKIGKGKIGVGFTHNEQSLRKNELFDICEYDEFSYHLLNSERE